MEPEQEALRLSSMIALCVGVYLITLSIDNFQQQKTPGRVGQVECTWWRTHFGGCAVPVQTDKAWTRRRETHPSGAVFHKL